ncbi:hypothetical protein CPC08DRAFT_717040, partial [Agrocybe pediades]
MPHTPSIEFCTSPGCQYKVSVIPCRGTKDPQDAGFFYERCNAPGPFSHWLKWRKDIPRLPQDELRYFPFGPAPATMLEALQIPSTPSTMPPFSSPMKPSSPMKATDPTSSPLKPAPTPLIPHTPIPPIVFSQPPPPPPLPAAPAFPGTGHILGDQTTEVVTAPINAVPPVTTSASAVPAPLDDRSHTRITIVNGKAKVSCNGPVCRENGKPPVRNAQFCVNQFCQKCCLRFQALGGPQCMGTHDPTSAKHSKAAGVSLLSQAVSSTTLLQIPSATVTGPVPTVPAQLVQAPTQPTPSITTSNSGSPAVPHVVSTPSLPNAVSNASGVLLLPSQAPSLTATMYNAKRPMDDAHYQAREAKYKAWEQRATQLTESRAKSELLKTTINIMYWRNATDIPDFLTIPCPSFPTFTLSECSSATRSMLSIDDDFDKFISTFDPNRARWVNHTAMTPRDISLHRTLLYRAPTVRDGAPDMQTSIDEVMELHAASPALKERYLSAGYTNDGLWKNFVREVRKSFPDGKIPNLITLIARHGKGKGKSRTLLEPMVLDDEGEIIVKAEPGIDVLPQVKPEPTDDALFKPDAREVMEISDD